MRNVSVFGDHPEHSNRPETLQVNDGFRFRNRNLFHRLIPTAVQVDLSVRLEAGQENPAKSTDLLEIFKARIPTIKEYGSRLETPLLSGVEKVLKVVVLGEAIVWSVVDPVVDWEDSAPLKTGRELRMKESYGKDLASHPDPESCVGGRKVVGEALTGAHVGQPLSCEIKLSGVPTLLSYAEGNTKGGATGKPLADPAQPESLRTRGNSLHGKREIPRASTPDGRVDRSGKVVDQNSDMHALGKSDDCVVPEKLPNNDGETRPAEVVEGRRSTEGNTLQEAASRTQSRTDASFALHRVREVARRDRRAQFTALLHHVTVDLLRDSFYALKRHAAPGIDGVTWEQYGTDLEARISDLHRRVHLGTYRAQPSRRTFIPKADGQKRPLGIAALEDKIVQQAVVSVLNEIYEVDFQGFSYGFRPKRGAHDALDALWVGLMGKKVNWVLDADIRGFFDAIDHGWLIKFLEHRIADRRVLRLIQKWLKAGVSEQGDCAILGNLA